MKPVMSKAVEHQVKSAFSAILTAVLFVGVPGGAGHGHGAADFGGADTKVCGFFDNINGLLNIASIAVVTIAIIFAGYQIAFAHKRIADVAPILIGGLLIGAAGQMARMLMGADGGSCGADQRMLDELAADLPEMHKNVLFPRLHPPGDVSGRPVRAFLHSGRRVLAVCDVLPICYSCCCCR